MIPIQHDFNRYITENPEDRIRSERWKRIFYKSAAVGLTFVMVAAIVVGAAMLLHYAPALLLSFLIVSAVIYKYLRGSLILYLQQMGDNAETRAHMYDEIKTQSENTASHDDFADFLIETCSNFGQQNIHRDFPHFVGRIKHWHATEMAKENEKERIDGQIQRQLENNLNNIDEEIVHLYEKSRRMEEDALICKISQAYLLHLLANPTDQRDIADFGYYQRVSHLYYSTSQVLRTSSPNCYFFNDERSPLTLENIKETSLLELKGMIFEPELSNNS